MRGVLADAAAEGERLRRRGLHGGDAVLVRDRGVHRVADPLGALQRGVVARPQAVRERPQPVVGRGQPGRPQQLRADQGGGGQHGRPVGPHPFEDGGQPELDRLGHPVGPQPRHHVAVPVPADRAPGLHAVHVEPVRAPVLAPVPGRRHHHQPLPQRLDRRVVLVAEALLEHVRDPPGGVQVEPAVIEQRRLEHPRIQHHQPRLLHPIIQPGCFQPVTKIKSENHDQSSRTVRWLYPCRNVNPSTALTGETGCCPVSTRTTSRAAKSLTAAIAS